MWRFVRSGRVLVLAALAVLLVGGGVLGTSLMAQQNARDDLTLLQVANDNLELAVQARVDEALGQRSLALTPADDEALAGHVDLLRELAPQTSAPGLEEVLAMEATIGTPDEPEAPMMGLALALDSLSRDTTLPVLDQLEAAHGRIWWSFWLTGLAATALLVAVLGRLARDDD